MKRDDYAGVVLDMLSDTMTQLNAGRSGDEVPCQRIAAALGADAAVTIALDPDDGPRVVASYPDHARAARLANYLFSKDLQHLPQHFAIEHLPDLGHVVIISVRPDQTHVAFEGYVRVLCFARQAEYDEEARALLNRACRPLAALWPHAARAYQAARAGEAALARAQEHQMTPREIQVLRLLADGLLATSIAARLALSPRTVHKHLGNIYRKLGVHDRLIAVSIARAQGLVDPVVHPINPVPTLRSSA